MKYIPLCSDISEYAGYYSEIAPYTYIYNIHISARRVCGKEPHT